MANKRSRHYDFFHGNSGQLKKEINNELPFYKKNQWKQFWKWFRRIFYLFLAIVAICSLFQGTFLIPDQFRFNSEIYNRGGVTGMSNLTNWGQAWTYGPWFGIFVYPIFKIIEGIQNGISPTAANGFGVVAIIVLSVLVIRFIVFLITVRFVFSQVKQQELNPKKAKIDAKYADFKGNKEMQQRKQQEIRALYKKNNVKMSHFAIIFLFSSPIFISLFLVIEDYSAITSANFLGIQMSGASSISHLMKGEMLYLPLIIIVVLVQLTANFLPRLLIRKKMKERTNFIEKQSAKKSNKTQTIMMVVFSLFGLLFSAGVQIYWITSGIFTICQTLFVHFFQKSQLYKNKIRKYI